MPIRIPDRFTMPVSLYKSTLVQLTSEEKAIIISLYYSFPVSNFVELANKMRVKHHEELHILIGKINTRMQYISSFKNKLKFAKDIIDKSEYNLVYKKMYDSNIHIGWKMQKHLKQ